MNINTSSVEGHDEIQVEESDMFRMKMPQGADGTPGVQVKSHGFGGAVIRLDKSGIAENAPFLVRGDQVNIELADGTSVFLSLAQAKLIALAVELG